MNLTEIATQTGGTVTERAIAILIAAGVATNQEIAAALGLTVRAIQKARKKTATRTAGRELQDAEANHSSPNEPQFANHSSPVSEESVPSPKRKVSPCTPSKENIPLPSGTERKKDSGANAPAPAALPSACKVYAFEGVNGRITQEQAERWRKAYPAVPDLLAELQACDDYYAANPERLKGKWFFACSAWLLRSNKREASDKRSKFEREMDEICPPEIYGRLQ
ncbi:MAG: hypothetical protein K2X43_01175 [Hyphomonadaceae bacterium]|jgi:hypothetical protein|nr:hypothetical protein [Hyphomonadaceae bacterium]